MVGITFQPIRDITDLWQVVQAFYHVLAVASTQPLQFMLVLLVDFFGPYEEGNEFSIRARAVRPSEAPTNCPTVFHVWGERGQFIAGIVVILSRSGPLVQLGRGLEQAGSRVPVVFPGAEPVRRNRRRARDAVLDAHPPDIPFGEIMLRRLTVGRVTT